MVISPKRPIEQEIVCLYQNEMLAFFCKRPLDTNVTTPHSPVKILTKITRPAEHGRYFLK